MDSVRYAVLGSGSSANAYIFEKDNFSFIIDNGFSLKELSRRAGVAGFDLSRVKFILLTHTHSDHFNGVGTLSRKYKIPVVVHHMLSDDDFNKMKPFSRLDVVPGKEYSFDGLSFTPFSTSHDACCSLGFYFSLGKKTFMLLTDTGVVTDEMRIMLSRGCNVHEFKKVAIENGFTDLRYDGLRKAIIGITTLEEVLRQTQ